MALLIAAPIVLGLTAGLVVRRLFPAADPGTSRIRGVPLVVAAAVVEALRIGLLGERVGEPWVARSLGAVDLVVVVLVVHLNRPSRTSRPVSAAVGLTGLGMAANALAVVIAGGMPFSRPAALAAGYSTRDLAPPPPGYVDADGVPAAAAALGDLLPFPPLMKVLSVGDLLLLLGIVVLLALLTAGRAGVLEPARTPVPTS